MPGITKGGPTSNSRAEEVLISLPPTAMTSFFVGGARDHMTFYPSTNLSSHDVEVMQSLANEVADLGTEHLLVLVPFPFHQLQHGNEKVQVVQRLSLIHILLFLSIVCDPYRAKGIFSKNMKYHSHGIHFSRHPQPSSSVEHKP